MAAINVTSANTDDNIQIRGGRINVRSSKGIPYVVVENETDNSIDVWKGASVTTDYYFDVSDAGPTDPDAKWTNDSNAFDGSTSTSASIGGGDLGTATVNELFGEGTNAPASGNAITQVRARAYAGSDVSAAAWGSYVTLTAPSGGWTWAAVQALETSIFITNPVATIVAVNATIYTNAKAETLGTAQTAVGSSPTTVDTYVVQIEVSTYSEPPASFSEQDTSNNPAASIYGSCSAAIDSSDIIHIGYMYDNGKTSQARYVTFDTSTDTFSGDATVDSDIGGDPLNIDRLYTSIAVDSSDIPHLVYDRYDSNMGADYVSATYNNRIGGAWNASPGTEIIGSTAEVQTAGHDLTIDADDLPVVALHINGSGTDDVVAYLGNANDASSFTSFTVFSDGNGYPSIISTQPQRYVSVAVDSDGNHQVAYIDIDALGSLHGDLKIRAHNYGDAWATTWQTAENIATGNLKNPSLVIDGTDRYIFCEDQDTADIVYYVDTGSGWSSATTLETGTYNNAVTKWAYWVDNDSTGALVTTPTAEYYADGSDVAAADPQGVWTNETNADDGAIGTYASTTTQISGNNNYLRIEGTDAPASGDFILSVQVEGYGYASATLLNGYSINVYEDGDGGGTNLSGGYSADVTTTPQWLGATTCVVPSGGWTWAKIQGLETWIGKAVAGDTMYASKVRYVVTTYNRASATEIDYTFTDETASPDVHWNTLSLAAEPPAATPIPPQIITW